MYRETFGAMDGWTPPPPLGFAQINFDTVVRYFSVTLASVCWDQKVELSFFWTKVYGCQTARDPLWVEGLKLQQR